MMPLNFNGWKSWPLNNHSVKKSSRNNFEKCFQKIFYFEIYARINKLKKNFDDWTKEN